MSEVERSAAATAAFPRHAYVHVPLCASKCRYCSFCSFPAAGDASVAEAVGDQLVAFGRAWRDAGLDAPSVRTLYLGGGTPTALGRRLVTVVRELREVLGAGSDAEVSVEANPDSFDLELACALASAGVTRVSVGVQSLDDGVLRFLGRTHDARTARQAVNDAVRAGLDAAADLICGVPGDTPMGWRTTIEGVLGAGARHVSVYPLSVEDGTPLAREVAAGRVPAPDDDRTADAMEAAAELLESAGLRRYETANFAVPGHESRHNLAYWTGAPYVGMGVGAHGMLTPGQAVAAGLIPPRAAQRIGRVRYSYPSEGPLALRVGRPADGARVELLSVAEAAREDVMLGMRLVEGVPEAMAERAEVTGVMRSLARDGLVEQHEGRWRTTARGWLLGNEVFGRIWTSEAV